MPNRVLGEGPSNPKIIIIGEAPGYYEDQAGKPFVGPSGAELDSLLRDAGINRKDCWVTNVVKVRPPENNLKRLGEVQTDIVKEHAALYEELSAFSPNVYIALGNTALQALTDKRGIRDWRGSILQSKLGPKLVATFHPAHLIRSEDNETQAAYWQRHVALLDIVRAKEESLTRELRLPYRNLQICKDPGHLWNFLHQNRDSKYLSIDIESRFCLPFCVGISFHKGEALSIPLFSDYSPHPLTKTQLKEYWRLLGNLFQNPQYKKIGQNFKYDDGKLGLYGLQIDSLYADTQLMMHTCYPELPKSLAFIASIFTREPYYKDEGKDFNPKKHKIDQMLLYNARDAAVTLECFEALDKELSEVGTRDFYYSFVNELHNFYSDIERDGFACDDTQKQILSVKYHELWKESQEKLDEIAGHHVNAASWQQVGKLLYEELKLPRRKSTSEDDLVALLANHAKNDRQIGAINLILDIRRYRKTISTYIDIDPDYDGRVRTSYRICGTETGRSSTGIMEPPIRPYQTGMAFQTVTKHGTIGSDVRSYLIPDQE